MLPTFAKDNINKSSLAFLYFSFWITELNGQKPYIDDLEAWNLDDSKIMTDSNQLINSNSF